VNFLVVGTNHKYSPIELREQISFSKRRLEDALFRLKKTDLLCSVVILSTCNRIEVYATALDSERGIAEIVDFISRYHDIDRRRLFDHLYIYKAKDAVRHLLSVSCGLDSLILGETQILGQVKFAFYKAQSVEFVDEFLSRIFYSAVSLAKKIHARTKISEGKSSVGSVAIDFIKKRMDTLSGKNILIIGIGKVTELVLKYLERESPNVVFVSNRTFEMAEALAQQIGAEAVRFDSLRRFLGKADIVISATSSPHFIIKKDTLEGINNKLLIIDLALPRDVDPCVRELKNVSLYSLEDLGAVIKQNIENKLKEAVKARRMVDIETEELWRDITESEPEPVLSH
jgi:glutamyl-tRNA reductase